MATVTYQQGVGGYAATHDTMLRESKPTKDFSTAANVNVDGEDSAGLINQGLLQFDDIFGDGPGQIPLGATITSATLTLDVSDSTKDAVALHRMLIDWSAAATQTWNSFGAGIQADGSEARAAADVTLAALASGSRAIDVTSSLQAWSEGAANNGWLIQMAGANGLDFSSSEGPVAPKLSVTYTVSNPGLGITQTGGSTSVTEGGPDDSIAVVLRTAPTANVTITVDGGTDVNGAPLTLTFTPQNWNQAQNVTLSAIDDSLVEGTEIKGVVLLAASADAAYNGLSSTVSVTIFDNDNPPGLTVTETGGSTVVTEGGAGDSISVRLDAAPTEAVTLTISGNADVDATPVSLTFTPGNWDTAQVISLAAIDDALVEGVENTTLTLTTHSGDAGYEGLTRTVSVRVNDNDSPPSPPPPPPPPPSPVVLHSYDTTQWKAGDPSGAGLSDPSGVAYVPGLDVIFIADSEHEESPFFSPTNLWAVRRDGTFVGSYSLTSFTKEPTGLAYNSDNGFLYIADDDADKVFWVNPSNPSVKVGEFSVKALGIKDAEDPGYDPVTHHLFVLDGVTERLFELTTTGQLVRTIQLPSVLNEAEGLAYDADRQVFYIGSGAARGTIYEIDRDGHLLATSELLNGNAYRNPENGGGKPKIKGLELAPSSDTHDGNHQTLYVGDYGNDQVADGRLIEIDLHPDWQVA